MAENYLITGYWGEPHVTAENDRGIHAAIFGAGRFVLPVGQRFRAEYIGNNTIRMYDGKLMNGGAVAGIPVGEYIDLTIANASQGMRRNDLICFQYDKNAATLVESGSFVVVKGTEASGTASDPTVRQGDIISGTASRDQMILYRVVVVGTTINAPQKLFVERDNIQDLIDAIESETNRATIKETAILNTANNAKNAADNAMPKAGGTFTGKVIAHEVALSGRMLKNVTVQSSSGADVASTYIIMQRK